MCLHYVKTRLKVALVQLITGKSINTCCIKMLQIEPVKIQSYWLRVQAHKQLIVRVLELPRPIAHLRMF